MGDRKHGVTGFSGRGGPGEPELGLSASDLTGGDIPLPASPTAL